MLVIKLEPGSVATIVSAAATLISVVVANSASASVTRVGRYFLQRRGYADLDYLRWDANLLHVVKTLAKCRKAVRIKIMLWLLMAGLVPAGLSTIAPLGLRSSDCDIPGRNRILKDEKTVCAGENRLGDGASGLILGLEMVRRVKDIKKLRGMPTAINTNARQDLVGHTGEVDFMIESMKRIELKTNVFGITLTNDSRPLNHGLLEMQNPTSGTFIHIPEEGWRDRGMSAARLERIGGSLKVTMPVYLAAERSDSFRIRAIRLDKPEGAEERFISVKAGSPRFYEFKEVEVIEMVYTRKRRLGQSSQVYATALPKVRGDGTQGEMTFEERVARAFSASIVAATVDVADPCDSEVREFLQCTEVPDWTVALWVGFVGFGVAIAASHAVLMFITRHSVDYNSYEGKTLAVIDRMAGVPYKEDSTYLDADDSTVMATVVRVANPEDEKRPNRLEFTREVNRDVIVQGSHLSSFH